MFSSNNLKSAFLSELSKIEQQEKLASKENQEKAINSWLEMEKRIKSSPALHSKFSSLQNKFSDINSQETKNYPEDFVFGVLSLNLQESDMVK